MAKVHAGNKAPNFELTNLDGKRVSLQEALKRGPTVVAFFKVSCPVCQFTFPFLQRLFERFGGGAVSFAGVSQDDAQSAKNLGRQYGVTFPMLIDEKSYPASNAYGLV